MEKKKFTKPELKIVNMGVESVIAASGQVEAKGAVGFRTISYSNNVFGTDDAMNATW